MYYYANDIIEEMKNSRQLVVFGAGDIAYLVINCLQKEYYQLPVEYCKVSDKKGNHR